MRVPFFIAKRYLFSKKKQSAINIISAISVVGVAIGTMALIVVLSVFNGIDLFLRDSISSLTPDIVILPEEGKFVSFDSTVYAVLQKSDKIAGYFPVIEENALLKYDDKLKPVLVKGVSDDYVRKTGLERNITHGKFKFKSGDSYYALLGYGVASELGVGLNFLTSLQFYYPNKRASSATSSSALNTQYLFPSAFFASQSEIDEKLVITDIAFAEKLFRTGDKMSKIEIRLYDEKDSGRVKKELINSFGGKYQIKDKYEVNGSFYAMMQSEKLVIFMILLFILLIASFNIIGSISMLIFDKREDLSVYKALGMSSKDIVAIFKTEGNLITVLGGVVGLGSGIMICLLQQKFGFLKLGGGSFVLEAYPVDMIWSDTLLVMASVLLIGYMASYFPVKYLIRRLVHV